MLTIKGICIFFEKISSANKEPDRQYQECERFYDYPFQSFQGYRCLAVDSVDCNTQFICDFLVLHIIKPAHLEDFSALIG